MSKKLQVLSYLAPNCLEFYKAVLTYLSRVLGVETQLIQGECDPLDDSMLLQDLTWFSLPSRDRLIEI